MSDYLFDTPYWVFAMLLAAAIGLFIAGNSRQRRDLKMYAGGVLGLAILLGLLSHFIDTDKEKAIHGTRRLIQAVATGDKGVIQSSLSQRVALGAWDRDDILQGYTLKVDEFGVKGIDVGSISATQTDTVVSVTASTIAHLEPSANRPFETVPSTWRFDWQESADGWHVTKMTLVGMPGVEDPARLEQMVFGQHLIPRPAGK